MVEHPRIELADYLLAAEIEDHILVQEEDSVRADWWRASCGLHDWYTTGSRPNVEDAAAHHVAWEHTACADVDPDSPANAPLYCRMLPEHGGDHWNGGHSWANDRKAAPAPESTPSNERCLLISQIPLVEMEPNDVPDELLRIAARAVGTQMRYHSIDMDVRVALAAVLPLYEQQIRAQLNAEAEVLELSKRLGRPGEEWRFDDGHGWFTISRQPLSDADVQRLREQTGRSVEHRIVGEWHEVGGDRG